MVIGCLICVPFAEVAYSKSQINLLASSQNPSQPLDVVWELLFKARQLAGENQQDKAVETLTQAFTLAEDIEDELSKNETLVVVIAELAKVGAIEEAIALTKQISYDARIEDERWFAARIKAEVMITQAYLTAKEYKQALEYARGLELEAAQSRALVEVVTAFSQAGKLVEAEEIALSIQENNYQQYQAVDAVIQSYSQKKKYQEALAFISTLSDEDNIYSVASNLAKNASRAGYYEVATAASEKISNPVFRVQVLESLADAHLAVGQQQEAKEIVELAVELSKQRGDPPLSHWLGKWLATGQEEKVRDFAAKLRGDGNEAAFDRSLLANAYLSQGKYQKAFEFAKLIPDDVLLPLPEYTDPKVELFFEIIQQSLTQKDFAFAQEVALNLSKKEDQVNALQTIARTYHENGNSSQAIATLDRAFNIAKTIEIVNVVPERSLFFQYSNATILIPLARDFVEFGQKQRGVEILSVAAQSINKFNRQQLSNSSTYGFFHSENRIWYIAEEYIELGEKEQAEILLVQAEEESLTLPGEPYERISDFLAIARLEKNLGNFERVKSIIAKAQQLNSTIAVEDWSINAKLQFASLLAEVGEKEEAMPGASFAYTILDEAAPQVEKLGDVSLSISFIAAYKNASAENIKLKPLISKTLQQINRLPSDYEKKQQLNSLVAILADASSPQLAQDVVQQVHDPEQKTSLLLTLAQKYNSLNNSSLSSETLNQALAAAQKIPDTGAKDRLLSEQVSFFDNAGYGFSAPAPGWDDNQIINITQAILQPEAKAYMFLGFAFNYTKAGNNQASEQTLTLALEAAQDIQDQQAWEDKLWETLQASLEAEEYDFAQKIALATGGVDYQITALRRIAQQYGIANQKQQATEVLTQAEELANTLEPGEHKEQVLAGIANQGF